jgi:hypothetical protein
VIPVDRHLGVHTLGDGPQFALLVVGVLIGCGSLKSRMGFAASNHPLCILQPSIALLRRFPG